MHEHVLDRLLSTARASGSPCLERIGAFRSSEHLGRGFDWHTAAALLDTGHCARDEVSVREDEASWKVRSRARFVPRVVRVS